MNGKTKARGDTAAGYRQALTRLEQLPPVEVALLVHHDPDPRVRAVAQALMNYGLDLTNELVRMRMSAIRKGVPDDGKLHFSYNTPGEDS